MKLVRYAAGAVTVVEEPAPQLPAGGLLVRTEACGLCSGELMAWYMDKKGTPVLGHEVAGRVIESADDRFPIGSRVFPHHHAPCLACAMCKRGAFVQCETWRKTKLMPGGMAEFFAVPRENLVDTHIVDDLRAVDAALAEPLACVVKSLRQSKWAPPHRTAVIGLGNMGLMHMLALGEGAVGYELDVKRLEHARSLGLTARSPDQLERFDTVFVCPGSAPALELALSLAAPRGTILLFAPFGSVSMPDGWVDRLYFNDLTLASSYSAGPDDSIEALRLLRDGVVKAEQVVSDFVAITEIPSRYQGMKRAQILKAMVVFDAPS